MDFGPQNFQLHEADSDLQSSWPLRVTLGIVSVGSLWLLGIAPLASVLVIGVLGVLIAFGRIACDSVGLKEVGIGISLVIGSGFLVLSGQFLLFFGIPAFLVHWAIIAGMASFAMFRHQTRQAPHNPPSSTTYQEIFSCLAIALLVLAERHPWLLFFALPVVTLERYIANVTSLKRSWILLALTSGIGLILSKQFQPVNWWYYYQGNDAQFFEATGYTLAKWGVFEHPGSSGFSFANYHWLTHAFFGQLARLASLGVFDALLKIGPLLIPFMTAGVLASRSRRISNNLFVLILLGSLSLSLRETDSLAFSIPIGFATLWIVERFVSENVKFQLANILFLCFVFVVLVFAKITTAVVVLVLLTLWLLFEFRTLSTRKSVPLILLGLICTAIYYLLFRQHPLTPTFDVEFQFARERLVSRLADQRYGTQLLTCAAAITLRCAIGGKTRNLRGLVSAAVVASIGSVCIATFVTGLQVHYWFLTASFFAVYIAISYAQVETETTPLNTAPLRLFVTALFLGFLIAMFWNRILHVVYQFLGQSIGSDQWDVVQGNGLNFISIIICIAIATVSIGKSKRITLDLALVLTFVLGFQLESGRQNYRSLNVHRFGTYVLENASGGNNAPFAGGDLQKVALYIRETTPDEAILGSNNFCCEGDSWWPFSTSSTIQAESEISPTDLQYDSELSLKLGPEWTGGANYLLPAYTRRRFLMQGLAFQIATQQLTKKQIDQMNLTLEFANSPTMQTVRDLKAAGVSGFVVNLSLTEHRDWTEFAIERIRSGNFVYLEFR